MTKEPRFLRINNQLHLVLATKNAKGIIESVVAIPNIGSPGIGATEFAANLVHVVCEALHQKSILELSDLPSELLEKLSPPAKTPEQETTGGKEL